MALFGIKKQLNTHKRHPDAYYKTVWVSKNMFAGIDWVAKFERVSKVRAVNLLLERGFRNWIAQQIKTEMALRERERKRYPTRFVRGLRKSAEQRGMDISKFF